VSQVRSAPASGSAPRRRADAQRSIEAILDAALGVIVAEGQVSMSAIAREAGVSRVTLYAHFATAESLVEAVLERAVAEAHAVLDLPDCDGGPAETLAALLRASWQILARYRNLYAAASSVLSPARLRAHHQPVLGRIEELIARGRSSGDFRTDLPDSWLVATVYALLHQTAEEVNAGRLALDQAGDVVTATLLSALGARTTARGDRSR
jgi:AcrR family transcriptional regulator